MIILSLQCSRIKTYNLQFHGLAVQFDGADFLVTRRQRWSTAWSSHRGTYKVHTDGGDVAFCVGVIGKTQQQAGLSNARVADEEQLEQVIVSVCGGQSSATGWRPSFRRGRGPGIDGREDRVNTLQRRRSSQLSERWDCVYTQAPMVLAELDHHLPLRIHDGQRIRG